MSKGQISFEYLVIVGIALLVIVPTLLFFLTFSGGNEDSVTRARVHEVGLEMLKTATNTYALGKHSWLTLDVNVPETVEGFYISNDNELVIRYNTKNGISDAVFYPDITLTNETDTIITSTETLNPIVVDRLGLTSFKFTSQGTNVSISVS